MSEVLTDQLLLLSLSFISLSSDVSVFFFVVVSEVGLAKVSWLVELRWDDGGAG